MKEQMDRWRVAGAAGAMAVVVIALGVLPFLLELFTRRGVDGLDVNAVRYVMGAVMLAPVNVVAWRRLGPQERRRLWGAATVPALVYVVTQVFYGLAPYWNNATMLNFGCRLSIPFTTLFGFALVGSERAQAKSGLFWGGLVLALASFVVMFGGGFGTDSTSPMGMALLGGFAVGWGLYMASIGRFLRGFSAMEAFAAVITIACPFHVAIMLAWGEPGTLAGVAAADWGWLLLSSFLGLVLANVLTYWAMGTLGPIACDASYLLVPFLTAGLAHVWGGESLRMVQWVAGCGLVGGCALLIAAQVRTRRRVAGEGDENVREGQ